MISFPALNADWDLSKDVSLYIDTKGLCGALIDALDYGASIVCYNQTHCEKKHFNLKCLALQALMGALSGCLDGIGLDLEAIHGPDMIINIINGVLGGATSGAADASCTKSAWEWLNL